MCFFSSFSELQRFFSNFSYLVYMACRYAMYFINQLLIHIILHMYGHSMCVCVCNFCIQTFFKLLLLLCYGHDGYTYILYNQTYQLKKNEIKIQHCKQQKCFDDDGRLFFSPQLLIPRSDGDVMVVLNDITASVW